MADETNAASAPAGAQQANGSQPYEVRVAVLTRLAGIPVARVRLEGEGKNLLSGEDGLFSIFNSEKEELNFKLTYAKRKAQLKTETVTIALKNLFRARPGGVTAEFEHLIPKIRDVLDLPEQDAARAADAELEAAREELGQELGQAMKAPETDPALQQAESDLQQAVKNLQWAQDNLQQAEGKLWWFSDTPSSPMAQLMQKQVGEAQSELNQAWQKVAAAEKKVGDAQKKAEDAQKKADDKIAEAGPENVDADFIDRYTINGTDYYYYTPPDDGQCLDTPQPVDGQSPYTPPLGETTPIPPGD